VIVLDTHALLWWFADPVLLSAAARQAIAQESPVSVSPISFWEVAMLAERGRISLDRSVDRWCRDVLSMPGITVAELTPSAAVVAAHLDGFHGDPADRFIYATALELGAALVTKDSLIRQYAGDRRNLSVIW
jgi:PIN domain nuclease of toxin-antitoxin system